LLHVLGWGRGVSKEMLKKILGREREGETKKLEETA
jgi:hypothetical protein